MEQPLFLKNSSFAETEKGEGMASASAIAVNAGLPQPKELHMNRTRQRRRRCRGCTSVFRVGKGSRKGETRERRRIRERA